MTESRARKIRTILLIIVIALTLYGYQKCSPTMGERYDGVGDYY